MWGGDPSGASPNAKAPVCAARAPLSPGQKNKIYDPGIHQDVGGQRRRGAGREAPGPEGGGRVCAWATGGGGAQAVRMVGVNSCYLTDR